MAADLLARVCPVLRIRRADDRPRRGRLLSFEARRVCSAAQSWRVTLPAETLMPLRQSVTASTRKTGGSRRQLLGEKAVFARANPRSGAAVALDRCVSTDRQTADLLAALVRMRIRQRGGERLGAGGGAYSATLRGPRAVLRRNARAACIHRPTLFNRQDGFINAAARGRPRPSRLISAIRRIAALPGHESATQAWPSALGAVNTFWCNCRAGGSSAGGRWHRLIFAQLRWQSRTCTRQLWNFCLKDWSSEGAPCELTLATNIHRSLLPVRADDWPYPKIPPGLALPSSCSPSAATRSPPLPNPELPTDVHPYRSPRARGTTIRRRTRRACQRRRQTPAAQLETFPVGRRHLPARRRGGRDENQRPNTSASAGSSKSPSPRLATDRALLLLGVPGTAKSWVSEHLTAAISGDSTLLVQGTAGTSEEAVRYGWNYALLLAKGPSMDALVPSPDHARDARGAASRAWRN